MPLKAEGKKNLVLSFTFIKHIGAPSKENRGQNGDEKSSTNG